MDGAGKLGLDEVWVIVEVEDQNDNSPRFNPHIRPIVAAVPASAAYGHFVTRITVSTNQKYYYDYLYIFFHIIS